MIKSRIGSAAAATSLAVTSLLCTSTAAQAAPPEHVSLDVSEAALRDPFLSTACGSPVEVSATATLEVTLWRNAKGLVTRELDRFPNAWRTFTAVETGASFRVRYQGVSKWDYGAGAQVGSEVTITASGLVFHVPGATAIAGHEVSEGGIVDHFDQGVPIVEGGAETTKLVGHFPDDVDFTTAICDALHL